MDTPLLEVNDLKVHFPLNKNVLGKNKKVIKAVDGVDFQIFNYETFGLVGESGCGKSTIGKAIMRLIQHTNGNIYLNGTDITKLSKKQMRKVYQEVQLIFQDPFASLNPRMSIKKIIEEPLIVNGKLSRSDREKRIDELLEMVGLNKYHGSRYPFEFSGGQRQRIGIARALALNPKVIIADEAVSALDVSIQSQVLNLLRELQQELGLTYLFISHDLSVVKHISDRIAVMYLGEIVELSNKKDLYEAPLHPYSQALLSSIPTIDSAEKQERIVLKGDLPSPINPPSGCPFHTRCFAKMPICEVEKPKLRDLGNDNIVACHLYNE